MSWGDTDEHIPVIDFETLSIGNDVNLDDEEARRVSYDICQAFKTIGFVYLKNTGIPESQVAILNELATSFFSLDNELKENYKRTPNSEDNKLVGWGAQQAERLRADSNGPFDLKETYDIIPLQMKKWPDDVVPNFQKTIETFFMDCTQLAHRVLDAMSIGLELKDTGYFRQNHRITEGKTHTSIRLLYYPPLTDYKDTGADQVRLGEHSDFGSITLLFQDHVGGLEVQCLDGVYRPAVPIPGAILINIGDMMQRWTSDKLVSNKHRVLVPDSPGLREKKRQSVAFFVNADDDCVIRCLDGSDKYKPVLAKDYLIQRVSESYF